MTLDARLLVQLTATLTSGLDLTTVSAPLSVPREVRFTNGAGAGQADLVWSDKRTVGPSTTDSLDLAGVLTSPLGGTLTFARIKALLVAASTANVTDIQVTRPATNGVPLFSAVSSGIPLPPGGLFSWAGPSAAGVVVTAGTGDLIDIVNGGGTAATYDVVIIGAAS